VQQYETFCQSVSIIVFTTITDKNSVLRLLPVALSRKPLRQRCVRADGWAMPSGL
jgi:hypothetical protein